MTNVPQNFKTAKFEDLLQPSILYVLVAPSTPESAREEAVERKE